MDGFYGASLNINGAREHEERVKLYELVKQKHIDIIMLQETYSDVSNAAEWVKEWEELTI